MADILFADAEPTDETCVETLRLEDGTVVLGTNPLRPTTIESHTIESRTIESRTIEWLDWE